MQVDFYQLGALPVERLLPRIAERVLAAGGRLLIVARNEAQAALIDARLWDHRPDSFLPHAIAGRGDEARQPILIALGAEQPANGARNVAFADGVWRDAALGFARAFHVFDEAGVAAARDAWRALGGAADVARNFWRQEEGGWVKVA